jgi:hypothetical protein
MLRAIRHAKSDPKANHDTYTNGDSNSHGHIYTNSDRYSAAQSDAAACPGTKTSPHSGATANVVAVKELMKDTAAGRRLKGLDVYARLPKWVLRLQ